MAQPTVNTETPRRPLLQTKLTRPQVRANPVPRPRLLEQLRSAYDGAAGLRSRLVLVTAPAGYGKSTLICQWLDEIPGPAAWLSLDAGDNDEARFLAYLFNAVAGVQAEAGAAALARLTSTYLYNEPDAILTAFLNALAAGGETVVLVLDDYHIIRAEAVHQIVRFLLQHAPPQLQLIITSRAEPPLPLALLRARGTLTHLASRDLQFTTAEVAAFMTETMHLSVTPAQVEQLDEQVEGWVTGLQLIALALKEGVALEQAFSGSQRYLVDYLAEQVLGQQPAGLQTFMLQTALLPQFNEDLCTAVTGQPGAACLAAVEAANLFLIPLDAERHWYRYHHLFADFLQNRLRRTGDAAAIAALHGRAAAWHRAQGDWLSTIDHALAAGDHALAADLMTAAGRELLKFGETNTVRRWLDRLPPEVRQARIDLRLFFTWVLIRTGDLTPAKEELEAISDLLETRLQWGEWLALRARLAVVTGDTDINIKYSRKALAKLPADQHMLRSEVAINLGFSHLQQADIAAAEAAFAEAAQNTAHDPGLWAVMFATFYWGHTLERQGRLRQAQAIYQRGLDLAGRRGRQASPAAGFMHIGLGELHYEWHELGRAETHLRQALRWAEQSGDHKMLIYSREAMVQLLAAHGDWAGAAAMVETLEAGTDAAGQSTIRAWLALRRGDLDTVQAWVADREVRVDDADEQVRQLFFIYLMLARFKLVTGLDTTLLTLLARLAAYAAERQIQRSVLEVQLLTALAHAGLGDMDGALRCFHELLTLAEPAGYTRLFLDCAHPMLIRLLNAAAANGAGAPHARRLLALSGPAPGAAPAAASRAIQPLSPRELEVLALLAQGLTNRTIAEQLFVSLNTVKAHTRRLYEKLGVNSRGQAVAVGLALGLLSPPA